MYTYIWIYRYTIIHVYTHTIIHVYTINTRLIKIAMRSTGKKIAQIAGNNSLTIARNAYENDFGGTFCKETVMDLTIVAKNAGFLAFYTAL